ncbi:hypothetical protein FDF08_04035 [Micrococcus luteus]|nr:hypothetical protein FDF08_04035 [Micrococcus luteus]
MTALASTLPRRGRPRIRTEAGPPAGALAGPLAGALALAAAPVHGVVLVAHSHGLVTTVVLLAMTAWCALCGARLLRRRGRTAEAATLRMLLVSAAAMVLAHAAMIAGLPGVGGGHHHGGGAADTAGPDVGAARAMLGVIVLELGVGLTTALALRRRG